MEAGAGTEGVARVVGKTGALPLCSFVSGTILLGEKELYSLGLCLLDQAFGAMSLGGMAFWTKAAHLQFQ